MKSTWFFYAVATGLFTGNAMSGEPEDLALQLAHLGADFGAFEADHVDHLAQKYDATTNAIVDYQPAKPADTDLITYTWDTTAKRWAATDTLKAVQDAKWEELKAGRDAREFSTFVWNGYVFDCNQISTARVNGAFSLALASKIGGQPYTVDWKLADNSVITMSGDDMIAAGVVLGTQVKQVHADADTLYNQVYAAGVTVEQVQNIKWATDV